MREARVVSKAKSGQNQNRVRKRSNIKRPAWIATDSGLRGESPAAMASALTYSKTSKKLGNKLKATVVFPEPFEPPII